MKKVKPNFNKLIAIICAVLVAVLVGGFSIGSTVVPKTRVKTGVSSDGGLWSYAIYEIKGSDAVAAMDMFVGDYRTYDENGAAVAEIRFHTTKSAAQNGTTYVGDEIKATFSADKAGDLYTFKRVFEGENRTSRYMRIDFKSDMDVYEMALYNNKGERLTVSLLGVRLYNASYSETTKALNAFKNLTDEQTKMPYTHSKYTALTKYETKMISSVESMIHTDGLTVSDSAMPLGVLVNSLGVLLFGANAFGARFMSYLFMIATLVLLYFIGKKYFGKIRYGIILSALYLLSTVVLSAATLSSVANMTAFTLLLAYVYLYKYLFETKNERQLYLSGLFLGLAINVQFIAVFALIGILAIFIYAKTQRKELSYKQFAIAFVAVPLVLTFITIMISIFFGYANYFETANPILVFAKTVALTLGVKAGACGIGGLIGLGALDLNGDGKYFAFVNPAYALLTLVSAIALAAVTITKLVKKHNGTGNGLDAKSLRTNVLLWSSVLPMVIAFAIFAKSFTVVDLPIILVFYTGFGAITLNAAFSDNATATVRANFILWAALLTIFFVLGFVGVAGYDIPSKVAKYLYTWFVF